MYIYEIYTLYMPRLYARCFTYAMPFNPDNSLVWYTYLFLFYKWKKNYSLAGYLICPRSNDKEIVMPYSKPGVFDSKIMLFSLQYES